MFKIEKKLILSSRIPYDLPVGRLELPTPCLKGRCSTYWATRAYKQVIVLLDHRKVSDSIRILHVKHVRLAYWFLPLSFAREFNPCTTSPLINQITRLHWLQTPSKKFTQLYITCMERTTRLELATARLEIWNSTNWATPAWFEILDAICKKGEHQWKSQHENH